MLRFKGNKSHEGRKIFLVRSFEILSFEQRLTLIPARIYIESQRIIRDSRARSAKLSRTLQTFSAFLRTSLSDSSYERSFESLEFHPLKGKQKIQETKVVFLLRLRK